MKKHFCTFLLLLGLISPLASRAEAQTEVSLNFFYDNLSDQGSWLDVAGYGYCFQPQIAVGDSDWRPYADGYWAYTDQGWAWVSYEDFGWATYHYGRWADLGDFGWVWVPGYEWAPAWVSWRTGGDYIGWAPLPPNPEPVYEGRAITGQVDLQFDIGPEYYNFVSLQYIGEPVLRRRIVRRQENVAIINRTVNVTNITYNNSTVYNYGPSYERVNRYSERPVQRLTIQRESTVNNINIQGGGRRNLSRVNNGQLTIVAPQIQKSQQRLAPKTVKTKVEKPVFRRGWDKVANKQQIQAEMKKENPKNIREPDLKPQKNRKAPNAANAAPNSNEQVQPKEASQNATPQKAPQENAKAQRQQNQQEQNANAEQQNANAEENAQKREQNRAQRRATQQKQQKEEVQQQKAADANKAADQPDEARRQKQRAARAARRERQNANANDNNADGNNNRADERKAEDVAGEKPEQDKARAKAEKKNEDAEPANDRKEQQADRRAARQERRQAQKQQEHAPDRAQGDRPDRPDQSEQQAAQRERAQQQHKTERPQEQERPQNQERRQAVREKRQEKRAARADAARAEKDGEDQPKAKKKGPDDENKADQP